MKTENGCYNCKDGFYRDILGTPCRYNFCPICGRKLDKTEELIDPAEINTMHEALQLVNQERNRQDAKWGEQNHPPQYWTGILYDNMMKERTQVAAVAVGAMEALMKQNMKTEGRKGEVK